jgi:hypothetical protein
MDGKKKIYFSFDSHGLTIFYNVLALCGFFPVAGWL